MSNIKELCKDVSFNRISNWMNITQKKLNNAKLNLGIKNDEIILFYDSSSFETGKNGLAVCENGIYWKTSFCQPRYLSWDVFRKIKLTYDKNYIYFGDKGSFFVFENEIENLVQTLHSLRMTVKVDNFVEKTEGIFSFIRGAIDFINELDSGSNNTDNTYNDQKMLTSNSNEVIEVACDIDDNKSKYEELVKEIENVKVILTYLSKDLIGDLINAQVNNDEEFQIYMVESVMTIISLTGDEELLSLIDEDTKQGVFELRKTLVPQLDLVENLLNSDSVNYIDQEKISLRKAINLYTHRVKVAVEEYDDGIEDDIEEVYNNTQLAVKDFRQTLKKMIKVCNLLIEKIYMES